MQCGIEDLKTFGEEIRKRLHPEDAIRTLMKYVYSIFNPSFSWLVLRNFLTGLITLHEKKHMVHQDIKWVFLANIWDGKNRPNRCIR